MQVYFRDFDWSKTWKVRGGEAKVAKYKCDISLDIIIISLIISKFDNYSKLFGTSSCYKTRWTCIRNWNLNKYVLESREWIPNWAIYVSKFLTRNRVTEGPPLIQLLLTWVVKKTAPVPQKITLTWNFTITPTQYLGHF